MAQAGFTDINIQIKQNAAEFIKDWMPGSGAENFITSAYVTATKPSDSSGFRDNVRIGTASAALNSVAPVAPTADACMPASAAAAGC